ncbi:hypothetical protein AUC70_13810 [Methyloceanibacter stevinii]|uniref:Uncharacterized protein n=1 Tax=Methyloceanibacter stevinii TaxID=1774970 RepID=A0A1E3VTL0_9HYPH|nr:hypothetical protein [Methyloceanibacter stevinii]ODR96859.1 hypothetical protein AUC70_13810 [Methyloceanibacter stevinii]
MKRASIGLAAIAALALAGPAFAQNEAEPDGFQQDEMPGSEIQIDIGEGGADVHRQDGNKIFPANEAAAEAKAATNAQDDEELEKEFQEGEALGDDREEPLGPNAIDEELPGEGPESLSGPDDDDPLPY